MGPARKARPSPRQKFTPKQKAPQTLIVIGDLNQPQQDLTRQSNSKNHQLNQLPSATQQTCKWWWWRRRSPQQSTTPGLPVPESAAKSIPECEVCFEEATVRPCCGRLVCHYCYTSRGHCPVCGIGVMHGKPLFTLAQAGQDDQADKTANTAGTVDDESKGDGAAEPSHEELVRQREAEAKQDHLECRICLDPGVKRKCCGGCFCDRCYYRTSKCPVCHKPTAHRGLLGFSLKDPGLWPVLLGGCVTATAVGVAVTLACLAVAVEQEHLRTLHGYTCYGYFPRCDRFACVTLSKDAWWAEQDELRMTNMVTWTKCDADTTASARGSTCVFDWDLWVQSGHTLGYDFCVGSTARDQSRQIDGSEAVGRGATFTDGAYVFDDDFELGETGWRNATSHKSSVQQDSLWQYIDGARVDDDCGAHASTTSLHFYGPDSREAVTRPLNVQHGGYVNFRLKMAPAQSDRPRCRANLGKAVSVYFAVPDRVGWTQFASLESAAYAQANFQYVSIAIPDQASTLATQFKLSQPTFERESDHWALDDVSIFRKFEPGWRDSEEFEATRRASRQDIAVAQCCFHTDQCESTDPDPKAQSNRAQFRDGCDDVKSKVVPGGKLKRNLNNDIYRLNGAYLYVSLAGLAAVYAGCYSCLRTYFTVGIDIMPSRLLWGSSGYDGNNARRVYVDDDPSGGHDEPDDWDNDSLVTKEVRPTEDKPDVNLKYVFKLDVDPIWQRRFALLTLTPLSAFVLWGLATIEPIILYSPLHAYGDNTGVNAIWLTPVPAFFVFVLACYLDARAVFVISRDVICLLPRWVPYLHVNLHPEKNCLDVGSPAEPALHVPLDWMEESLRFTKNECTWIAALYVATCQPWSLITLCVGSLHLPYATVSRLFVPALGCIVVARAFAGPHFLVKLVLGTNYLFARSPLMRDHIGAALKHRRTAYIVLYTVAANFFLALLLVPSDQSGHVAVDKWWEVLAGISLVVLAAFSYALLVGCLQGLPITPYFKLTKVDGGLYFTFVHHASCPCYAHFHECSDMHTRKKVCVFFLEDIMSFFAILKGEQSDDDTAKFLSRL